MNSFPNKTIRLSYNSGGKAAATLPILERLWRYKIVWISPNFTLRSYNTFMLTKDVRKHLQRKQQKS